MNAAALRDLPVEQRIHLVEELWNSIAADQGVLGLTDAQRQELDRRLDAFKADRNPGQPTAGRSAGGYSQASVSLPLRVHPGVAQDIEDAAVWYEDQRRGLGQEFLAEVRRSLQRVAKRPELYPSMHRNTRRALTHRFPFGEL